VKMSKFQKILYIYLFSRLFLASLSSPLSLSAPVPLHPFILSSLPSFSFKSLPPLVSLTANNRAYAGAPNP